MTIEGELKEALEFVKYCTIEQAAEVAQALTEFHSILVFNKHYKCLDCIESVSINGDSIQLNLEENESVNS